MASDAVPFPATLIQSQMLALPGDRLCYFPATPTNGAPWNAGTASSSKSSASRSQRSARRASRVAIAPRSSRRGCLRDHSIACTIQSHAAGVNEMNSPLALSSVKQCSYSPRERIRSQSCNAYPVFHFRRLCVPLFRRSIRFPRRPPFDMPAIQWQIFWHSSRLNRLARHVSVCVPIRPSPANPCEPRPAPNHPEIGLAVAIRSPSPFHAVLN